MSSRDPNVDLEDLAALLEGGLAGAERQRVIDHLGRDDAALATFAAASRMLEEAGNGAQVPEEVPPSIVPVSEGAAPVKPVPPQPSEAEKEPPEELAPVVRHPRARRWGFIAGPLAAMLALWVLWPRPAILPQLPASELSGFFDFTQEMDWSASSLPVYRSGGMPELEEENQVAFRLGVETQLFEAILRTQPRKAIPHSSRLSAVLVRKLGMPDVAARYESFKTRILEGASVEEILADTPAVDAAVDAALLPGARPFYRLGKWVQAARWAVESGNDDFFAAPLTRQTLDALKNSEETFKAKTLGRIQRLAELAREPDPASSEELRRVLEELTYEEALD